MYDKPYDDTWIVDEKRTRLYKGSPMPYCPKTYTKIKVTHHNHGSIYNSNIMTLFTASDGTLRYEIYRDGCLFPYYGKLEFLEE